MRILVFGAALLLAGCATGSDFQLRQMEGNGKLSVARSSAPGADYIVTLKNAGDLDFDPEDPQARRDLALAAMAAQCRAPRIVGEDVITTGKYLIGTPARTYAIRIKC